MIISASRTAPRNACKTKALICVWMVGIAGKEQVYAAKFPRMKQILMKVDKKNDISQWTLLSYNMKKMTFSGTGINLNLLKLNMWVCLRGHTTTDTACLIRDRTPTLSILLIIGLTSLSCFPHLAWIMTLFMTISLWVNIFSYSFPLILSKMSQN